MNARNTPPRRRPSRRVSSRGVQGGTALRGAMVVAALAAAVGLQVAGPRLQGHLAGLVGISATAPAGMPASPAWVPASVAPCSSASGSGNSHSCKVASARSANSAGFAPIL